jgi:heme exporter protein B
LVKQIFAHLKKDFLIEFRNRYSVSVAGSFAVVSTLAISLASGGAPLPARAHAIILWVIMFFTAMSGLAHIFVREEDRGTALFLRLHSHHLAVFTSKLLFNVLLFACLQALIVPLYLFFLSLIALDAPRSFATSRREGCLHRLDDTAAIVARAGARGRFFPCCRCRCRCRCSGSSWGARVGDRAADYHAGSDLLFLLAFSGAIVAVSYLLLNRCGPIDGRGLRRGYVI